MEISLRGFVFEDDEQEDGGWIDLKIRGAMCGDFRKEGVPCIHPLYNAEMTKTRPVLGDINIEEDLLNQHSFPFWNFNIPYFAAELKVDGYPGGFYMDLSPGMPIETTKVEIKMIWK
jgi:hypothetical protein